jgi:hypothetical protein
LEPFFALGAAVVSENVFAIIFATSAVVCGFVVADRVRSAAALRHLNKSRLSKWELVTKIK